jgi:uncharacterized protein (TIGR03435 family)
MNLCLERLSLSRKIALVACCVMAVTGPVVFDIAKIRLLKAVEAGGDGLPVFSVASIKLEKSPDGPFMMGFTPDGFTCTNIKLSALMMQAYGVQNTQIAGAPNWTDSTTYDIEAKVDSADVARLKDLTPDQRSQMLRPLLADRFKLTLHWGTKDLPVYVLAIAKNGTHLRENVSHQGEGGMMGRGQIRGTDAPISALVRSLSHQAELGRRPILDHTGLTGDYDWDLNWTPNDTSGTAEIPDSSGPSIFTAIQEQLGLKLQPQTASAPVIVIDHVEKPSQN